jgi:hypothetical protein
VAEFGSWATFGSGVVVTNSGFPGPVQGSQFLQIENTGVGSIGATLSVSATNYGDVVKFDTMAYVSPLAYTINAPYQFLAYNTAATNNTITHAPLNASIGPDGVINYYSGSGNIPTLTRITYGQWQHWEIQYVVGSGKWSWFVDGDGDSNIGLNQNVSSTGIQSFRIFANQNAAGIPLYLDGMPDLALLNPRVSEGIFAVDFESVIGKFYFIQHSDDLSNTNWQTNPSVIAGDGFIKTFNEPVSASHRFYRLLAQ